MIYPYVVRVKANELSKDPKFAVCVGDSPAFYTGRGNYAQRLNIKIGELIKGDRALRLAFVSWLVQRQIKSTKELTLAEAAALISIDLKKPFEEFTQGEQNGIPT